MLVGARRASAGASRIFSGRMLYRPARPNTVLAASGSRVGGADEPGHELRRGTLVDVLGLPTCSMPPLSNTAIRSDMVSASS